MKLKGYKTLVFNALAAVEPALSAIPQVDVDLIPAEYMPIYTVAVIAVNVFLRFQTDTAVGKRR